MLFIIVDKILIASILESERKQMDDIIKAATEFRPQESDTEEEIAERYVQEQKLLEERLQEEREKLMRSLSDDTATEDDAVTGEVAVVEGFASSKYAIQLRLVTMSTRLDFAELRIAQDRARLDKEKKGLNLESGAIEDENSVNALLSICRSKREVILLEESCTEKDSNQTDELSKFVDITIEHLRGRQVDVISSRAQHLDDSIELKIATVHSFTEGMAKEDKKKYIDRALEEGNKIRDMHNTLNESDARIFASEEETIRCILKDANVWSACVRSGGMRSGLHTRAIAGEVFDLISLKRCATLEEEFVREAALIHASSRLLQSKASRGDIERELYRINKEAREASLKAHRDLDLNRGLAIEEERLRQSSKAYDYETEYAMEVERSCHRSALVPIKVSQSHLKSWILLKEALEHKRQSIAASAEAKKQPYMLQSYFIQQIEKETSREKYEMKSVYLDLVFGFALTCDEKWIVLMLDFCRQLLGRLPKSIVPKQWRGLIPALITLVIY